MSQTLQRQYLWGELMSLRILHIYRADDSKDYYTTTIKINDNDTNGVYTASINPKEYRTSNEPTIAAITHYLLSSLGLKRSNYRWRENNLLSNEEKSNGFSRIINVGESGFVILFQKTGIRYSLNGHSGSKALLLQALARTIFQSCFTTDGSKLNSYLYKNIELPENVSYALENRAPYHWFKDRKKIDVRLNVKQISDKECAIEISDSIWASISIKDLNTYMNFYWKDNKRGSWKQLGPKRLWMKLMKSEPSEAQLKLMKAFLEQNRTQDIVEERAKQLMSDIEKEHSNRIKLIITNKDDKRKTWMIVRGKLADWVLTDNTYKTNIQMVSTFIYATDNDNPDEADCYEGNLTGPICIDNLTNNSSVGDQFAARALALLNDDHTTRVVNTIKRYLNDDHIEGQDSQRLDWDNLEEIINEYVSKL